MLRIPAFRVAATKAAFSFSTLASSSSFLYSSTRFASAAAATTSANKSQLRTGAVDGSDSSSVDIAKFSSLPTTAVERLPSVDRTWLLVDGAHRQRLEKFISGGSGKKKGSDSFCGKKALASRTEGIKKHNDATEIPSMEKIQPKLAGAINNFIAGGKSDVSTLFQSYDELSLLLKGLEREREVLQLEIWGYNDAIQLGLKFFGADKLAQSRKGLTEATKKIKANRVLMKETVAAAFNTEVMNDMLNILRISFNNNKDMEARELGVQILDDLSLFNVPFNEETQLLFRNLVFGDLPHDDSGLLFEIVEGSVGGNVSVQKLPPLVAGQDPKKWSSELDAVAEDTLKVISKRFQTPLSPELVKLKLVETHPMLQRSPE